MKAKYEMKRLTKTLSPLLIFNGSRHDDERAVILHQIHINTPNPVGCGIFMEQLKKYFNKKL